MYGFESGRSKKAIAANRKLAEELKQEKGFIYEVSPGLFYLYNSSANLCKELSLNGGGPRKGMYNHPIIQKAINTMWFQNKRDEGVNFTKMFKPIPVQAIAFVLTAVCHYFPMCSIIDF
jgi:hypothetical protein